MASESAEPQAAPEAVPAPRWGLGDALLGLVTGLVVATITGGLYDQYAGGEGIGLTIVGLISLWVGLAGVPVLVCKRKGSGSLARDFGLWIEARDVPLGVVAGLFSQFFLVTAIVGLFRLVAPEVEVGGQAKAITNGAGGLELLLLAPFLVIGAPLVEELFFRGLLQRSAARRFGPVAGAVLSAIAFGSVHAQGPTAASALALVTAIGAFAAVLGFLTLGTGRLGPALVAHTTFNLASVVLLALS